MNNSPAHLTTVDDWTESGLVTLDPEGAVRLDPAVSGLTLSPTEARTLGRVLTGL